MGWLAACIGAVLVWGLWGLWGKLAQQSGLGPRGALGFAYLGHSLIALPVLLFFREPSAAPLPRVAILYAALAGLAGTTGGLFYYYALSKGPTGNVVALAALYPTVTALLAIPVLGETITPQRAAGIFCAILAGVLLSR